MNIYIERRYLFFAVRLEGFGWISIGFAISGVYFFLNSKQTTISYSNEMKWNKFLEKHLFIYSECMFL